MREDKIVERLKSRISKNNLTVKGKRKKIEYSPGNLIYLKNHSPDKVDPKWKGPYKVIKMSSGKNNVYVDKGNKIERVSVNNVRPCRGGEDVALINSPTNKVDDSIDLNDKGSLESRRFENETSKKELRRTCFRNESESLDRSRNDD
ncbi:hypothetical protein DMUE_3032 [Dictyocoela muelleri]|nr:hypothetical protein DMUE_3032 [Dictyocoela muelleri]